MWLVTWATLASGAEPEATSAEPSSTEPSERPRAVPGAAAARLAEPASVAEPGRETRAGLSLTDCLRAAERHSPKLGEVRARLRHKRAQEELALFAPYSEFSVSAGLAVAPTVRGTALYSVDTDTSLGENQALAWQAGVEGAVPLYTFGKIENARSATAAQSRVGEGEVDKERNELRLTVHRAYYGALLARDALSLVREALRKIDDVLRDTERALEAGEGDDIELVRLQIYRGDLASRESEAREKQEVALASLRFLTGFPPPLSLAPEPFAPVKFQARSLSAYLDRGLRNRPEIHMARAGVDARKAQVRLEQSKLFPDIGLGLSAKWSHAPEVTDQRNPYVRDSLNYLYFVGGLVMKYKLDFLPQLARIDQARAQLSEVLATQRLAREGVRQQVEEAYAELLGKRKRLELAEKSVALTKSWLLKVQQGIDVGTMDDRDIIEPAREFALKRFAEMNAVFEYNMAVAKLEQVTATRH